MSEDTYKNDLFIAFLSKLITLFNEKKTDEIRCILTGSDKPKIHKSLSNQGAKYLDNDVVIKPRLWTDNETKRWLDILYYTCTDENDIISLNNKIIELWLYEMNSEMSRFFYKAEHVECDRANHITLKIENQIWNEFIRRCEVLDINIPDGFKACINDFIEQKARIYL